MDKLSNELKITTYEYPFHEILICVSQISDLPRLIIQVKIFLPQTIFSPGREKTFILETKLR